MIEVNAIIQYKSVYQTVWVWGRAHAFGEESDCIAAFVRDVVYKPFGIGKF